MSQAGKLTELVEALVARGIELEEPNPVVRVLVDGRWYVVERVIVDRADESVILVAADAACFDTGTRDAAELEHWE